MATGVFGGFQFVAGDETYADEFIGPWRLWTKNLDDESEPEEE